VLLIACLIEGVVYALGRSGIDGLLADVTPPGQQGRVQANYTAVVATGQLVGATASGALYLIWPGVPFSIAGLICLVAGAALFLPCVARLVRTSYRLSVVSSQ
jgi:MFS family permease